MKFNLSLLKNNKNGNINDIKIKKASFCTTNLKS